MAIDARIGNKVIKNLRREDATGTRVDPYPYIGIVKNNLDPTRSGRVQVWIPDLGGPQDDPKNWRTVSYASPFQGSTSQVYKTTDTSPTSNTFTTVNHSYGMWMVPPDIGVEVIVMFIAGDPLRGYWLACINTNLSHYMIPTVAGTASVDTTSLSDTDKKSYAQGDVVPVAEFNENQNTDYTSGDFYNIPKPIHETQYNILQSQGLEKDPLRGAITSSSQRESPSYVFGISTPGRPLNDPANDPNYLTNLNSGTLPSNYFTVKSRKGGHSFIMDDGDAQDKNQLVRLRSAAGHQLLMNDSENFIYIGTANGTSWVELSANGTVNVFTDAGFNVRSQGAINLHSDTDVNINAGRNISLNCQTFQVDSNATNLYTNGPLNVQTLGGAQLNIGGELVVGAAGQISLKAGGIVAVDGTGWYAQSGKTKAPGTVKPLVTNSLADTTLNSNEIWQSNPNVLRTIVTSAPTHEPYDRSGATNVIAATPTSTALQPETNYTGNVDATKLSTTQSVGVKNPVPDSAARTQPVPPGGIGPLSVDQVRAIMAQQGWTESSNNYELPWKGAFLGKYQQGAAVLHDQGYVTSSTTKNSLLNTPGAWTGKDNITCISDYLKAHATQDIVEYNFLIRNYNQLVKSGAISTDMTPAQIGGMLAVSTLLGAGGAHKWRETGIGGDTNGATGAMYYNRGVWAVSVLAPRLPGLTAG